MVQYVDLLFVDTYKSISWFIVLFPFDIFTFLSHAREF